MTVKSQKLVDIDFEIYSLLPESKYISIIDLSIQGGYRHGTVRNSLTRLIAENRAERTWHGNERFGRYLYRQMNNTENDAFDASFTHVSLPSITRADWLAHMLKHPNQEIKEAK